MKNQQLGNSKWIYEKDNNQRELAILDCLSIRGVASYDHIVAYTKLTEHPVRDAIKYLMAPPIGFPPLIRTINVALPGQRGRSVLAYVLTDEGACSLGDQYRRAPTLTENSETAHALMEMNIFISAMQASLTAEVEKVIPYDKNHNVRLDVLINNGVIFEIEQRAGVNNISRITNKLIGYTRFFNSTSSKHISSKVRVLFGLSSTDQETIKNWQYVFTSVSQKYGKLPFELYWQDLNNFIDNPSWDSLMGFKLLEPSNQNMVQMESDCIETTADTVNKFPPFVQRNTVDLFELNLVMSILKPSISKERNFWSVNRKSLFELMESIYDGSHYKGGPVETESAFPVSSLNILHSFLHLHQNANLLKQLQFGYKDVKQGQFRGIIFFRNALTHFYWDVFLKYFSFGRNGPLEVWVCVPSMDDERSDIYTKVRIKNQSLLSGKGLQEHLSLEHLERSLEWVLDALFLYADELGLITDNRGKGKSR